MVAHATQICPVFCLNIYIYAKTKVARCGFQSHWFFFSFTRALCIKKSVSDGGGAVSLPTLS